MPRIDLPEFPRHLRVRGNDGRPCFLDDADRWLYLKLLGRAARKSGCAIHAYVLMTNHVHLVATGHCEGSVAEMMRDAGSRYVVLTNRRHRRSGTLFEGRYRASVVDSDGYLLTCMRYVEDNPVRAGMVGHPSQYPWSSFAENASGSPGGLVTPHALYRDLAGEPASRAAAYRRLFDDALSQADLEAIRNATSKNRVLGSATFCEQLGRGLDRVLVPRSPGRPKKGTGNKQH